MKLNVAEKQVLRDYIFNEPKYRETYNELYDHLINALSDSDELFSIELVAKIINEDFGGFINIRNREEAYQKQLHKKYIIDFRKEMLQTLGWSDFFKNISILGLCFCIYYGSKTQVFNIKPMIIGSMIPLILIALFGFFRIFTQRIKYSKYSIVDNYVGNISTLGTIVLNVFLFNIISKERIFDVSNDLKLIATLVLFFLSSIYIRSFIKFYNKKIKVLTA
ncbi:hypothetical protein QWY86_07005 [Pedobacter aquatilis]|uniref:hypothetical protein n=1 Tax=Pedobacter aquatilis TaxID=351343 RepID=UPI0025B3C7A8|nr:hypothetical protein [Pedobacter aquatilis]MDN3586404.1 hypothetical protein [Pedobacter aquatilis]